MVNWRKASSGFLISMLLLSGLGAASGNIADDKKMAAVDEVFADLTKAGAPGCALGVYRDGKIIYSKGFGWRISKKM